MTNEALIVFILLYMEENKMMSPCKSAEITFILI